MGHIVCGAGPIVVGILCPPTDGEGGHVVFGDGPFSFGVSLLILIWIQTI